MKRVFIFLFLVSGFYSTAFTQIKSGTVTYKVSKNADNIEKRTEKGISNFQRSLFSVGETLKFQLKFNKKESLFNLYEELASDKNDFETEMTVFILRGKNIFYSDLSENILLEQQDFFGETVRLKKGIEELNWKLTTEKKQIGDYTCYKATGTKYGTNKNKEVTETPITLWYCPELPYQFGPFEAVGLPGLVLEYALGDFIWTVEELELSKVEQKIQVPKSGIMATEEELKELMNKKIKN